VLRSLAGGRTYAQVVGVDVRASGGHDDHCQFDIVHVLAQSPGIEAPQLSDTYAQVAAAQVCYTDCCGECSGFSDTSWNSRCQATTGTIGKKNICRSG